MQNILPLSMENSSKGCILERNNPHTQTIILRHMKRSISRMNFCPILPLGGMYAIYFNTKCHFWDTAREASKQYFNRRHINIDFNLYALKQVYTCLYNALSSLLTFYCVLALYIFPRILIFSCPRNLLLCYVQVKTCYTTNRIWLLSNNMIRNIAHTAMCRA